ncbi:putative anti-sigma factor antagonist [invertebrate metagenome]|uniref:Putative anti-sigma factor antagonist n=1 Tax=invertebrate metagenome TaxID=1711999 RepID=A0A2H9T804_9ZZZZ
MSFDSYEKNGFTVISVSESRLDASISDLFQAYVCDRMTQNTDQFIIDLSSVKFMDSSGLGTLVACFKKINGMNKNMYLASPQPAVKDLLDLTSMDKIFQIFTSLEQALNG